MKPQVKSQKNKNKPVQSALNQTLFPQSQASIVSTPNTQNMTSLDMQNRVSQETQPQENSQPIQSPKVNSPNIPESTAATATVQAIQGGAHAPSLDYAMQHLDNQSYINLCEKFVENAGGQNGVYPSAAAAWQSQQDKVIPGLDGIKQGDAVYFAPDESNREDGHAGIYSGNGNFISATAQGVKQYSLNAWQKLTGQQVLGYIPKGANG